VITRSRWFPAVATGLVGLLLGIMIGAVGVGLVSAVWRHAPVRGDNRGHHWQDNRPPMPRPPRYN
jgi:hypothetical protein